MSLNPGFNMVLTAHSANTKIIKKRASQALALITMQDLRTRNVRLVQFA